jgi:subtilase family serine protease
VSISSPAGGTTIDQSSIEITGSVTKDSWESYSSIILTLQVGTGSVVVPIGSDGTFVYSVALSEGLNTIVARASDGVNLGAPVTVTATRTVTPWATYAIIVVIIALILAAIAIFRRR